MLNPLRGDKKRCRMSKDLFLEENFPSDAKEEISLLYSLGVEIEELEFLIKVKFKESLNLI